MATTIRRNRNWGSAPPDDIEALFDRLRNYTLSGAYEGYEPWGAKGSIRFWGNFDKWSAVFDIVTDDPKLIRKLKTLYRKNRKRPDYFKPERKPAGETE